MKNRDFGYWKTLGPEAGADRVVDGVPQDGGHAEQEEQRPEAEGADAREAAGGEEERVARQEGRDHQARLQEDDQEEDRVGVVAVALDDLRQMLIEVKQEVDEVQWMRSMSSPMRR